MLSFKAETKKFLTSRLKRLKDWSEERATGGVNAYEQFMKLKAALKDYKATKLSPTPLLDEVWHLHVLDTQRYAADCFDFCGEVIHYDIDGDVDVRKLEIRRNATKVAYEMQNGKEPEGEMWTFDFSSSSDQSLQNNSNLCEEAANNASLMDENENDLAEFEGRKILMTIDATNKQEFHDLRINASNGNKFMVQITDDVGIQEVLESVGNFEGRTDFEEWRIVGKDDVITYVSFGKMRSLIRNHGLNWTIDFPGKTLARRFKKEREISYINLIPASHSLQTYYVDVKKTSSEYYRIKVHKETSLQEIIRVLPSRTGTWKLANEEDTLKEINLPENSIVNLEFKSLSDADWFQIFVKTPNNGTLTLEVFSDTTIASVKEGIKAKIGLDVTKQRLLFAGKQLTDGLTLSDYYVSIGSTVFLEPSWNQATSFAILE